MRRLDGETVIDCATVIEALEAHLDGDLEGAQRAAIEAHLERCPGCAAEHQLAAEVRSGLRALPELDAPRAVVERVFKETVRRQTDGSRRPWRRRRRPVVRPAWAALAAAALAAVVVGSGLWLTSTPSENDATADAAAVARATEEARYALAYVAQVSRRTGLKLRQDLLPEHLVDPSARSLNRALAGRPDPPSREGASGNRENGAERAVGGDRERS